MAALMLCYYSIANAPVKVTSVLPNQELSVLYGGAHSQLWETTLLVFSSYAPRKYDKRFGTPAIVWFTGWN